MEDVKAVSIDYITQKPITQKAVPVILGTAFCEVLSDYFF
jgi:hypothetical protein